MVDRFRHFQNNEGLPQEDSRPRDQKQKLSRRGVLGLGMVAVSAIAIEGATKLMGGSKGEASAVPESAEEKILQEQPPSDLKERIRFEVQRAEILLRRPNPLDMLASPYLVDALYFSDAFIKKIETSGAENPGQSVIGALAPKISLADRMRYVRALGELSRPVLESEASGERLVPPFSLMSLDFGQGKNHTDAIDIFAPEGTEVCSVTSGIVVLAETGWDQNNPFSTSSFKGGNAVIVYDPKAMEFYRYCHFDTVAAQKGSLVQAGARLGTVGNTGQNASRAGHGNHLHLEINRLNLPMGEMASTSAEELQKRLAPLSVQVYSVSSSF